MAQMEADLANAQAMNEVDRAKADAELAKIRAELSARNVPVQDNSALIKAQMEAELAKAQAKNEIERMKAEHEIARLKEEMERRAHQQAAMPVRQGAPVNHDEIVRARVEAEVAKARAELEAERMRMQAQSQIDRAKAEAEIARLNAQALAAQTAKP